MKKIFLFISLLFAVTNLMAEPIGEKRAREIAMEFFAQRMTRSSIGELELEWAGNDINAVTRTGSNLDDSLMYIYNSNASDSFVIVGGDTNADLVIAYSLDNTFDMEHMADATKAILDAWCRQIEDARKDNKSINISTSQSTRANNAILYQTANWSQEEPYNLKTPIINGKRSLTGCAATAMSIICHYNKWPNKGIGTTPEYEYYYISEDTYHLATIPANELDSTYEYNKMLMTYSSYNYNEEQADAVATLMKDMGTAIKMSYSPDGSGATKWNVLAAFGKYFSYSKDAKLVYANEYNHEEWINLVRNNLRNCGGPSYYTGSSYDDYGHAFVLDGYDEDSRFHFNYGWSGICNGYYFLPSSEYYQNQSTILNLKPDKDGTSQYDNYFDDICLYPEYYKDYSLAYAGIRSFATSYSKGVPFECLLGSFYNRGLHTFNGEIAFVLCDRQGNWKQVLWSALKNIEPSEWDYESSTISCTITEDICEGDNLRIYYKGEYSNEWKWARNSSDKDTVDEVFVIASPEDIAKNLSLTYKEIDGTMCTILQNKQAMKIDIYGYYNYEWELLIPNEEFIAFEKYFIPFPAGNTYKIELSLGSDPYELILKF